MNGLIVPEIQSVCNHTLWIFVIKRFWNQLKEEVQLSCIVQFSRRRVAVENEAPILKIVRNYRRALDAWLESRRAVSRALPAARRKAYDHLTADYHWEIVNDDDGVGLEID